MLFIAFYRSNYIVLKHELMYVQTYMYKDKKYKKVGHIVGNFDMPSAVY